MYTIKNLTKKLLLILLLTFIPISPLFCKTYNISIIQVVEHPALNATREGILEELKDLGYDANFDIQSAQANPALAAQIAQKFASNHPDAIVAIGTTAAQASKNATKGTSIPVIFASVTDPVSAKLVNSLENPEGNVTGVSNLIDIDPQFELFRKLVPHLKTLGIIYNPGEANSVEILTLMEEAGKRMNIKLETATASKTSEVMLATRTLCGKADAVFINNDNTALAAFKSVANAAKECEIPAFVSDVDLVDQGALAALGPNQKELGKQTARMIDRILQNPEEKLPSVEFPEKKEEIVNSPKT